MQLTEREQEKMIVSLAAMIVSQLLQIIFWKVQEKARVWRIL